VRVAQATRRLDRCRVVFRLDPRVSPAILAQVADPEPTWRRDLDRIAVPTLIVRGASSLALDGERATLAAAVIADCRVAEVSHAGHSVQFDNPTGFLEAVCRFLD